MSKPVTHEEKLERFNKIVGWSTLMLLLSIIVTVWVWATAGIPWQIGVAIGVTQLVWYLVACFGVNEAKKDYIKQAASR